MISELELDGRIVATERSSFAIAVIATGRGGGGGEDFIAIFTILLSFITIFAISFMHPQQGFSFSPRKSEPPRTGPIKPTYFFNLTTVSVASLLKLYRLDLSFNNISGIIPLILNHLTHLLTLSWCEVPNSLSGFLASAFEKNSVLRGVPLEKSKLVSSDPARGNGVAVEYEEYYCVVV
ncbi:Leucine-rich repeat transmembrane protein kinase family protein [Abeliophyllum distichum]|uniref:Leucine-rich repeat transmembrane protein kinase family protein n=1 Tax=Abeliophyllum distichum TaxID=126358 RepID=A0ABD1U425_9LAMI